MPVRGAPLYPAYGLSGERMEHPGQIKESIQPVPAKVDHSRQTARLALYARLVLGDALSVLIGFSLAGKVRDPE